MINKKIGKVFFIIFLILIGFYFFDSNFFKKDEIEKVEIEEEKENLYSSNVINDVSYTTKDTNGNEYLIKAMIGEIDFNNSEIIYLTKVIAVIKLINSNSITITSDFGKYNINNYDTIFSKNVIITYLNNKITGDYLDFSWDKNLMIISREVILQNDKNSLRADVIEVNIKTKDIKIFMYEDNKKVNIKSLN